MIQRSPLNKFAHYVPCHLDLLESGPCDESAPGYDPFECKRATCNPASPDYNWTECEEQK